MKILFVWTGVTSYMADCWRELKRQEGVELEVWIVRHESGSKFDADMVLSGLDARLVDDGELPVGNLGRPDIVFAVGWHSRTVRRAVRRFVGVPKICCFDMPWRWSIRCFAARVVLWPFLRHYAGAFVPGAAAARYAKWLGFKRIDCGLFAIGDVRFAPPGDSLPRTGFLYVGREAPEKRLDLLDRAFARYRELGGTWRLDRYGGANFIPPADMPRLYAAHACLVLASAFDPWPLVVLEARASGCGVIASDRCGNADELEAIKVPFNDVEAMARAMLVFERAPHLAGDGVPAVVADYTARAWTRRVLRICKEVAE